MRPQGHCFNDNTDHPMSEQCNDRSSNGLWLAKKEEASGCTVCHHKTADAHTLGARTKNMSKEQCTLTNVFRLLASDCAPTRRLG